MLWLLSINSEQFDGRRANLFGLIGGGGLGAAGATGGGGLLGAHKGGIHSVLANPGYKGGIAQE
eukprot:scaffold23534_cov13-Prasinocladus_malaysianus.AAC.1